MTLYEYPPAGAFGRIIPKEKIYAHGSVSPKVRELFVSQVAQIRWKYKLAPETIHVSATPGVLEIQVFDVTLKGEELNMQVLRCMDEAIPTSVIYELRHADRLRVAAAPKVRSGETAVMGDHVFSGWMPADAPREPLPVALDLERLYGILLSTLVPFRQRAEEPLKAWILRLKAIQEKQKETAALESRLRREKQFNRQIPINRELRQARRELEELCRE